MNHKCPKCKTITDQSSANPDRPFCSRRCRLIDLGSWLDGDYAIAGRTADDLEIAREIRSRRTE